MDRHTPEDEIRQREHFARLLESSAEGIYGMAPDGSCIYINRAGAEMLGYSPEELIGRPIHGVVHHTYPDGAPYPLNDCHIAIAANSGTSTRIENEVFWHKDGTPVPVSYSVNPILVEGRPAGAVVNFTDESRRRDADEKLAASEALLRLATAAAELGMWTWTIKPDTVVWENGRMYEIFGVQKSAGPINAAKFVADVVHPEDADYFSNALLQTVQFRERFYFEGRFLMSDGEIRWVEFTGLLECANDGTPWRVHGTAADITRRKRTEGDLRKLAAQLSEANQQKGEFLATLAQELRNPLAPIRTGLALLGMSGQKADTLQRVREMLERQVSHMVHLVDDLLDVARINSGKIELKKARISLSDVISSAIETSAAMIDSSQHTLIVNMPQSIVWINADQTRMVQVVDNLLTNAAKYTNPQGRIELSVTIHGSDVTLSVTDTGVGISPDELKYVFNMFSQVGKHIGQSQGGLGIGLSLVRHLVELHDGSATAHSEGNGKGSTFAITLPLAPEIESAPRIVKSETGSATSALPLRVLIADDNKDAALALSEFLAIHGHEVKVAFNGTQALRMAQLFASEIVILDIGMPEMNGYEVARTIRGWGEPHRPVLIALTGWGADHDRNNASEAGFDFHYTKPVQPIDIATLLRELPSAAPRR